MSGLLPVLSVASSASVFFVLFPRILCAGAQRAVKLNIENGSAEKIYKAKRRT